MRLNFNNLTSRKYRSYSILFQAATNSALLSASPRKGFLIGGVSAGANFATVLSRWARDDEFFKDQPLTGQVLQIAGLIHSDAPLPEKFVTLSILSPRHRLTKPRFLTPSTLDTNTSLYLSSKTKTLRFSTRLQQRAYAVCCIPPRSSALPPT